MNFLKIQFFFMSILLFSRCSTLNESLELGASTGLFAGAAATYAAQSATGHSPPFDNVSAGASIGLGIGLLTSYIIHGKMEEHRQNISPAPEIYFGDLPPSPFIFPKATSKNGGI
jgi:hypothetical protein